ncbi:MAG: DUF3231 family protein [Peptococcaceae bacterium]
MVFSIRKKSEQNRSHINVQEAYNLWDVLSVKYGEIEHIQIWENFAHDFDLKFLLNSLLADFKKDAQNLEREMGKYGVSGIDSPRKGINTASNSEVITDEFISQSLFIRAQETMEMLLRIIRTSTTNDNIRKMFIKMERESISRIDVIMKYLKLKGWINQPPLYPNIPGAISEQIDCGEAYHLWDHLTFRYDNIQQTQILYEAAHDGDFKALLKTGLEDVLSKQAEILEKECLKFGLPLPKRPPNVLTTLETTEILEDDYMFRILNSGIQGAAVLHASAVKQCLTNDKLRKIFVNLLYQEINMADKLTKFGKLKSWFNEAPQYTLMR